MTNRTGSPITRQTPVLTSGHRSETSPNAMEPRTRRRYMIPCAARCAPSRYCGLPLRSSAGAATISRIMSELQSCGCYFSCDLIWKSQGFQYERNMTPSASFSTGRTLPANSPDGASYWKGYTSTSCTAPPSSTKPLMLRSVSRLPVEMAGHRMMTCDYFW